MEMAYSAAAGAPRERGVEGHSPDDHGEGRRQRGRRPRAKAALAPARHRTRRLLLDRRQHVRKVAFEMPNESSTKQPNQEWPQHFGPGCPPASAHPFDGELFYLVEACPPRSDDFKCAINRGCFLDQPHCLRAGLSCAVDSSALEKRRERVPRLRTFRVASATLCETHGRYERTTDAPDHYTMWLTAVALAGAPTLFSCLGAGT